MNRQSFTQKMCDVSQYCHCEKVGKTLVPGGKPFRLKEKNKQLTQLTYGVNEGF